MNRNEQARFWLIVNDPEAADFWASLPADSDFVNDVRQNIRDFGPDVTGEGERILALPA